MTKISYNVYIQSERLRLKEKELIAKVQRHEHDRNSTEVKGRFLFFFSFLFPSMISRPLSTSFVVCLRLMLLHWISCTFLSCIIVAILTARIRNFQEHLQKHSKVSVREHMQPFCSVSLKLWEHFTLYLDCSLSVKQDILCTHWTKNTSCIDMDVK